MTAIPVFKACTREHLIEKWGIEFPLADWVSIELLFQDVKLLDKNVDQETFKNGDVVEYETNRYDAILKNEALGQTLSVFLYMNESSDQIIAIDSIVRDLKKDHTFYRLEATPFMDVLKSINK